MRDVGTGHHGLKQEEKGYLRFIVSLGFFKTAKAKKQAASAIRPPKTYSGSTKRDPAEIEPSLLTVNDAPQFSPLFTVPVQLHEPTIEPSDPTFVTVKVNGPVAVA